MGHFMMGTNEEIIALIRDAGEKSWRKNAMHARFQHMRHQDGLN